MKSLLIWLYGTFFRMTLFTFRPITNFLLALHRSQPPPPGKARATQSQLLLEYYYIIEYVVVSCRAPRRFTFCLCCCCENGAIDEITPLLITLVPFYGRAFQKPPPSWWFLFVFLVEIGRRRRRGSSLHVFMNRRRIAWSVGKYINSIWICLVAFTCTSRRMECGLCRARFELWAICKRKIWFFEQANQMQACRDCYVERGAVLQSVIYK